jgi:hypothetical protein
MNSPCFLYFLNLYKTDLVTNGGISYYTYDNRSKMELIGGEFPAIVYRGGKRSRDKRRYSD